MSEILKSIKRAPYQSLASFSVLFFTLFLSLFFFHLTSFFYGILSYVETKPEVTVYFDTKTQEKEIFKIRDTVLKSGKAADIKYVSQKDALQIYRDLNRDNPLLLEMVSADILPPSLGIYAKRPEFLSQIAEYLKKQPGVDEVEFQKNIVDKLLLVTMILRRVAMFVFLFLIFISFVVLITTTAFKIALKKDEIELLQLLGASNGYIRKPFLFEGIFFGFSAATLSFSVFYLIYFYFQPFLNSYLTGIPKLSFYNLSGYDLYVWPQSLNYVAFSYAITVIFGVVIGFCGNLLATSKYIKS